MARLLGIPQDIEWAWADGKLFVLQSRPITSLFPVPEGMEPEPLQVLVSLGAFQGMLDPMTPLGHDVFRHGAANVSNFISSEPRASSQRQYSASIFCRKRADSVPVPFRVCWRDYHRVVRGLPVGPARFPQTPQPQPLCRCTRESA